MNIHQAIVEGEAMEAVLAHQSAGYRVDFEWLSQNRLRLHTEHRDGSYVSAEGNTIREASVKLIEKLTADKKA